MGLLFRSCSRLKYIQNQAVECIPINSFFLKTVNLPRKHPDESASSKKLVICDFFKIVPLARFFSKKFTKF